ncbi:MAG: GNAT family N-acetyltransferase [Arenimonas sp.]
MKYDIRHNRDQQRFETQVENLLCVIDYELDGATLLLTHVGVPKPIEGRGIAGELTRVALDWARSQHYQVVPVCPYVQAWLRRRPDYQDLVESSRA